MNFAGFKNIVGLIRQPEFIHSDVEFLKTLEQKELDAGMTEIIKGALIADKDFFVAAVRRWHQEFQN